MDRNEYEYHYKLMEALDPDQLVADLELETEDIMVRFPTEVRRFIEENYG